MSKGSQTLFFTVAILMLLFAVIIILNTNNEDPTGSATLKPQVHEKFNRLLITPHSDREAEQIMLMGVRPLHDFTIKGKKMFTANVPKKLLVEIKEYADVEQVKKLYLQFRPSGPPSCDRKCGDGACQGFEDVNCCPTDCVDGSACGDNNCEAQEDCAGCPEDCGPCASNRIYFPDNQVPWGIKMMYGDDTLTQTFGGAGITVAVLDSGINQEHADLMNRIKDCVDFTAGRKPRKNRCNDVHGHGTHVAGTIAADAGNDRQGIYGMAPHANLFVYRVCDNSGSCWEDDVATAIRYAGDKGANIISMSLGGDTESILIQDAVTYAVDKGLLVVAAAGNDGPNIGTIDYPGANAKIIAAAALNNNEAVPDFSSRGINDGDFSIEEREVEVVAPGVSTESTWNDGGYRYLDGTSMATPHISGLAAKLWSSGVPDMNNDGTTTAAEVRAYIQTQARYHDITVGKYAAVGDDAAAGLGFATVR